ncbi:MAG: polyamine aminopropyltransferase [Nitrososphaerota archaeon]|nr:polyamine aminopropyltransferase [Nitrososphaerota archaeon]
MNARIPMTKFVLEWITESLATLYGIKEVIYSGETRYQKVDIVRTYDFGLVLLLDGLMQSAEFDEYIYHELLVHPSMITHPNPRRVLIIGGGEGATAREVERHPAVEEIHMADLDGELIEIAKKYLPWSRDGFKDPRLKLYIEEGRSFLSRQPDNFYDVIIMDATDPAEGSLAVKLYTKEFYSLAYRKLKTDGLIATHAAPILLKTDLSMSIFKTMNSIFPRVCIYASYIKSLEGMWSFIVGSKEALPQDLSGEEVDERIRQRGVSGLKFYSGKVHRAIFELTEAYLKNFISRGEIFLDERFSKTRI